MPTEESIHNDDSFEFYIIADEAIESGHPDRLSAIHRSIEIRKEGWASIAILNPRGVEARDIDPDDDDNWISHHLMLEGQEFEDED